MKRADEKKQIISMMGKIRKPKTLTALKPFVTDTEIVNEACQAAVEVADRVCRKNGTEAKEAIELVLKNTKNEKIRKRAGDVLKQIK